MTGNRRARRGGAPSDQLTLDDAAARPAVCPTCGRALGDLDAPGQVGRDHPETSRQAAALPKFGSQRWRVLEVLDRAPATAAELADATGLSRNQCATRLLELRQGGYAERLLDDDGGPLRRATGPRTEGWVHRTTPLGRSVLTDAHPNGSESW